MIKSINTEISIPLMRQEMHATTMRGVLPSSKFKINVKMTVNLNVKKEINLRKGAFVKIISVTVQIFV